MSRYIIVILSCNDYFDIQLQQQCHVNKVILSYYYYYSLNIIRSSEERHIDNSMLEYQDFLVQLNSFSSQMSMVSDISVVSQGSQVSPDNTANFESSPEFIKHQRDVRAWITKNVELITKAYPPTSQYAPTSVKGKAETDYSVYVGCGGNAYVHWKLTQFFEAEGEKEKVDFHRKNAISAIEVALSMLPSRERNVAFYIGSAGMCCFNVIYVVVVKSAVYSGHCCMLTEVCSTKHTAMVNTDLGL